MRISFEVFWMPKGGNSEQEYEDAYWLPKDACWPPTNLQVGPLETEGTNLRFAIADGATETSFSGLWARALCERFGDVVSKPIGSLPEFFADFSPFQKEWQQKIQTQPMPWFAEEKARSGAFSSLVGLQFFSSQTPESQIESEVSSWEAMAIGDSCLFHIRDDVLLEAFPLSNSKDFNNSPFLLSSVQNHADQLAEQVKTKGGSCQENDVFYLLTDAIAASLLAEKESDGNSTFALLAKRDKELFKNWILQERSERHEDGRFRMRNDDVTLIRIQVISTQVTAALTNETAA